MRTPINRHRLPQLAADLAIVVAAWFFAFRLRFDTDLPVYYEYYVSWQIIGLVAAIKLSIFALFGFYNRWWRYVSTRDMWGAARGVVAASLVTFLVFSFFDVHAAEVPRTVWVIDGLLTLALVAGSRMLARTIIERPQSRSIVARGKEVIVVGAGDAAQLMLKEILRTPDLGYTPIGLVDDDPRKKNMRLHGIRVLGTSDELPHLLRDRRPDELLIAIPSASGEQRARIVEMARAENVPVKTLPGLNELIAGDLDLARQVRPVEVEDLLGREPVETDVDAIASYVQGKTVLVTGAGGSIGSELCRQLARAEPTRIVMVDQAESSLFEIERELVDERRFSACVPVLADVRDRRRLGEVFERYRPDVVFHAAAYKHVPLMEANPLVSVANNVLGTRNVAGAAIANGVERFVLISTDKALNPYSVYGQTKTLCEWIVGSHGERDDVPTKFVAVRFGNVLNSAGSVIPLFRRQIERGGPGDGHGRRDDALLHDDPGSGRARDPGRRDRRPRPDHGARHGRADPDPRPGAEHDPALRQGARPRRPDLLHRRPAGREDPRGALRRRRDLEADDASEDRRPRRLGGRARLARGQARRAGAAGRGRRHARARRPAGRDRPRAARR